MAIALGAGLLGGTVGGAAIGAVQAWMARGRGTRVQYFGRLPGPPVRPEAVRVSSGRLTGMDGFDRFDERAKRVLSLAQDEAIRHNHNYIGTEHLLAALLRDGDTIAARALWPPASDFRRRGRPRRSTLVGAKTAPARAGTPPPHASRRPTSRATAK